MPRFTRWPRRSTQKYVGGWDFGKDESGARPSTLSRRKHSRRERRRKIAKAFEKEKSMTVKELIEKLQTFPQDANVFLYDTHADYATIPTDVTPSEDSPNEEVYIEFNG